jgi:hypothetical protein
MRRDALILVAIAAITLLMAATAQGLVRRLPTGHLAGVQVRQGAPAPGRPATPTRAERRAAARSSQASGATIPGYLDYSGGPVIHTARDYLVFWDPSGGISQTSRGLFERYLTDVSSDPSQQDDIYGVVRQFTDSSGFAGARQLFTPAQAIADTAPYPPLDANNCATVDPVCVTDAQIQTELGSLIARDGLPSGLGAPSPIYIVVLPSNVDVCVYAGACSDASASFSFCAYHASLSDQTVYATIPMAALSPDPKGCQSDGTTAVQEPNGDVADVAVDNMSHELNESITDPLGTAWWDQTTGAEVADDCEAYAPTANESNPPQNGGPVNPNAYQPVLGGASTGTLYDQVIGGDHYYTQTAWSNGDLNCQAAPAPAALTPIFDMPAVVPVGAPLPLDPTASFSAGGVSSTTWSFGDGASGFSLGAPTPVTHTYTQPGTYAVTLILVDQHGNLATATRSVRAAVPPSPAFAVTSPARSGPRPAAGEALRFDGTHTTDANAGATIVRYAWSFGDGSTATGAAPAHRFARAGTYSVTLAVTDSLGMSQTITEGVLVYPASRILRVWVSGRRLQVKVSGAGTVAAAGHRARLRRPGTARLALRLSQTQLRRLAAGLRVTLRGAVTYAPVAGPRVRHTYRITLR